jgi:hypothetical protein
MTKLEQIDSALSAVRSALMYLREAQHVAKKVYGDDREIAMHLRYAACLATFLTSRLAKGGRRTGRPRFVLGGRRRPSKGWHSSSYWAIHDIIDAEAEVIRHNVKRVVGRIPTKSQPATLLRRSHEELRF